jgi:hypothetical protein
MWLSVHEKRWSSWFQDGILLLDAPGTLVLDEVSRLDSAGHRLLFVEGLRKGDACGARVPR